MRARDSGRLETLTSPWGQARLEQAVLDCFASTLRSPADSILAEQRQAAVFVERDLTGVGFYSMFDTPRSTRSLGRFTGVMFDEPRAARIGEGVEAHFLLAFTDGRLSHLEGMTMDGVRWPDDVSDFQILQVNA